MNINNVTQFLPGFKIEYNPSVVVLYLICGGIFIYFGVFATKNYFFSLKEVYGKSEYRVARFLGVINKGIILVIWFFPFILSMYLIFFPYEFEMVGEGNVAIEKYSGNKKEIKIPSKILVWDVVEIGYHAFEGNNEITILEIPNSIIYIRESAFSNCFNLKEVILSESVLSIGGFAFAGCENLETVTFSEKLETIGTFAFADCKKLRQISEPGEHTTIGTGAFCNTIWLYERVENYIILGNQHYIYIGDETEIVVPEGIKTVDFYQNATVESIILPESLEEYSAYCFQGCSNLRDISISSDTVLRAYCLGGCTSFSKKTKEKIKAMKINDTMLADAVETPYRIDNIFRIQCRENVGVVYNELDNGMDTAEIIKREVDLENPEFVVCIAAYKEFLNNYESEMSDSVYSPRYDCVYIDEDTLPELLIADSSVHLEGVHVYSYIDGMIKELGEFGQYGSILYAQSNNRIAGEELYNGSSGSYGITYYEFREDMIEKKGYLFQRNSDNTYMVNEDKVTSKEYNQKQVEFSGEYDYIRFEYSEGYELTDETGLEAEYK